MNEDRQSENDEILTVTQHRNNEIKDNLILYFFLSFSSSHCFNFFFQQFFIIFNSTGIIILYIK